MDRSSIFCAECINNLECPVSPETCLNIKSWHQLVPRRDPPLWCCFCRTLILTPSNPYKCKPKACKQGWIWHRDLIEQGSSLEFSITHL